MEIAAHRFNDTDHALELGGPLGGDLDLQVIDPASGSFGKPYGVAQMCPLRWIAPVMDEHDEGVVQYPLSPR